MKRLTSVRTIRYARVSGFRLATHSVRNWGQRWVRGRARARAREEQAESVGKSTTLGFENKSYKQTKKTPCTLVTLFISLSLS